MAGYYDPNKDYSKELQRTDLTTAQRQQLTQERQNKINDKYGGVEPNMTGSNKTYTQTYGGSSGGSSGSGSSSGINMPSGSTASVYNSMVYGNNAYSNAAVKDPALMITKNQALAGQSVKIGNYTVTFNENGYVTKKVRDNGASATSVIKTTHAGDSENHQLAYQAAQAGDWDAVGKYIGLIGMAGGKNQYGDYDMTDANQYMSELQNEFKYDARDYYDKLYDEAYGDGSSATFDATGGTEGVVGGSSGLSGGLGTDGYGSFEEFLAGTGYDQYAEATRKAIQAAVQNAIDGYNQQIETTNDDTKELARQAYIAKMLGQKNLDQQLAANGYAGGMADSQRIATEAGYQNQLNELELQRAATVKELESAITSAQLSGDMQTAQELASYLQQIQSQWVSYVQNQQAMAQQNYWNQKELDNQNYWNQQSMNVQNTESAYTKALTLLKAGFMPDDETLAAAGISKNEAQSVASLVQSQLGLSTSTGSRNYSSYNNGSLTTSQVKQLQQILGVTADGLWGSVSSAAAGGLTADQAWAQLIGNNTTTGTPAGGSGFSSMAYSSYLSRGDLNGADAYLERYWDSMSQDERNTVNRLISAYGL